VAAPSFDEYWQRVQAQVPGATLEDARRVYRQDYGTEPVLTAGPSYSEFKSRVQAQVPDAPEADIERVYRRDYGAPLTTDIARGLGRGGASTRLAAAGGTLIASDYLTRAAGGLARLLPGRLADSLQGIGMLGSALGGGLYEAGREGYEKNAAAADLKQTWLENPAQLTRPDYWLSSAAEGAATTIPTLATGAFSPAVGTTVGTLMEALPSYAERRLGLGQGVMEASGRTAAEAAAIAALNRLGIEAVFGKIPGVTGRPGRALAAFAGQGLTEWLEEGVQGAAGAKSLAGILGDFMRAMRESAAVVPGAALTGSVFGAFQGQPGGGPSRDEQEARRALQGLRPAAAQPEAVPAAAPPQAGPQYDYDLPPPRQAPPKDLGPPVADSLQGAPFPDRAMEVVTARGTRVPVVPTLVELDSLRTSSDEGYDPTLQPRDRSDRAAMQQQELEIAANLDPMRLRPSVDADRGAPIVRADGQVLSGNGRTNALRLAVERFPEKYQAYVQDLAAQGFQVEGMRQPVLVMKAAPLQADWAAFTREANESATARMSPTEAARADAARLTDAELGLFRGGEFGDAQNRDFVRAFLRTVPPGEVNALIDREGTLSPEGVRRIQGALLAKAYGDNQVLARALETNDNNMRAASGAMLDAAPAFASLRADVQAGKLRPEFDIGARVVQAVELVSQLRAKRQGLREFLDQKGLFGDLPPETEAILRGMHNTALTRPVGRERMADFLRFYAKQAAAAGQAKQQDLLGGEAAPATPADLLRQAAALFTAGEEPSQAAMFAFQGQPERRARPMPASLVGRLVNQAASRWTNGPRMVVAEHASDLPVHVLMQLGPDITAAYIRERTGPVVYVVADKISDRFQLQRALAHDVVGHYGFINLMQDRWQWTVEQVNRLSTRDPLIRNIAADVDELYRGVDSNTRAAEIVAALAERSPKHPLVQRVLAQFKEALRKLGFGLNLSRNDLVYLLNRSAESLRWQGVQPVQRGLNTAEPVGGLNAEGSPEAYAMRQATDAQRLPPGPMNFSVGRPSWEHSRRTKQVQVQVNPDLSALRRMGKDAVLRYIDDQDGNRFVWASSEAMHFAMARALKLAGVNLAGEVENPYSVGGGSGYMTVRPDGEIIVDAYDDEAERARNGLVRSTMAKAAQPELPMGEGAYSKADLDAMFPPQALAQRVPASGVRHYEHQSWLDWTHAQVAIMSRTAATGVVDTSVDPSKAASIQQQTADARQEQVRNNIGSAASVLGRIKGGPRTLAQLPPEQIVEVFDMVARLLNQGIVKDPRNIVRQHRDKKGFGYIEPEAIEQHRLDTARWFKEAVLGGMPLSEVAARLRWRGDHRGHWYADGMGRWGALMQTWIAWYDHATPDFTSRDQYFDKIKELGKVREALGNQAAEDAFASWFQEHMYRVQRFAPDWLGQRHIYVLPERHPWLNPSWKKGTPYFQRGARARLHTRLFDAFTRGWKPTKKGQRPTCYVMMGGPGVGKSGFLRTLQQTGKIPRHLPKVDIDDARVKTPEFTRLAAIGDTRAAILMQAEASDTGKAAVAFLTDPSRRASFIWDGTFGDVEDDAKKLAALKDPARDYEVVAMVVSSDPLTVAKDIAFRSKQSGRFVPDSPTKHFAADAWGGAIAGISGPYLEYVDRVMVVDRIGGEFTVVAEWARDVGWNYSDATRARTVFARRYLDARAATLPEAVRGAADRAAEIWGAAEGGGPGLGGNAVGVAGAVRGPPAAPAGGVRPDEGAAGPAGGVEPPQALASREPALVEPAGRRELEVGGGVYGNIPLGELNASEFDTLERTLEAYEPAVGAQRRGTVPWDETEQRALELIRLRLGITLDGLVNRKAGSAANAEQLLAYGSLLGNAVREVERLAADVRNTGSDQAKVAFMQGLERLAMLAAPTYGAMTEAGRALNILRKVAPLAKSARAIVEGMGDGADANLLTLAGAIGNAGSRDEVLGIGRALHHPDWWDKFYEGWINGLLSGPVTHAVNIVSNAFYQAMETASNAAGAFTGDGLTLRQVGARVSALGDGISMGLRNAREAWQTQAPVLDPMQKMEVERLRAIGGLAGDLIRTPGRALLAEDEFFKGVAYQMELAQQLMAIAERESPQDPMSLYRAMFHNLEAFPEAMAKAREAANKLTFTTRLGPSAGAINHALVRSKVGKLIVPFVRTPTNIVKSSLEYMPVGALAPDTLRKLAGKGDPMEAARARGRQLVGLGLGLYAVQMAAAGLLSGAGPDDPAERQLLYRTGWQPYSAKLGGTWYKYNRFEPLGMLLGIAADMHELAGAAKEEEVGVLASMLVMSFANNLGDKTFLRGITDFMQAYSDPARYGKSWVEGLAGTLVPSGAAQIAYAADPFQREANTVLDAIKARVPGMRQDLATRVDIAGEPIETSAPNPLRPSPEKRDVLAETMLRLGVYKSRPSHRLYDVELSDQEYRDYAEYLGKIRQQNLVPMVQSPQFRQLMDGNPAEAARLLDKAFEDLSREARTRYLYEHPSLYSRAWQRRNAPPSTSSSRYLPGS
jgi:hypothetical protein